MPRSYDFSGWASKNNLLCSDGRTIRENAFAGDDGKTVPLVYQHSHDDVNNVLGHALLENRPQGVYCYATFNDTENGQAAKKLVQNGDIRALSIYANHLSPRGSRNVEHGEIKEVSLVLAGANPGAFIDNVYISHGDGNDEFIDEAIIYTGESIELCHADSSDASQNQESENSDNKNVKEESNMDKTIQDVIDTMSEEQKQAMYAMIGLALKEKEGGDDNDIEEMSQSAFEDGYYRGFYDNAMQHNEEENATIEDVIDTMTDAQKDAMYAVVGMAVDESQGGDEGDEAAEQSDFYDEDGGDYMKHNVFDENEGMYGCDVLSHDDVQAIFDDAKSFGSLKESVLAHTATYGIDNIGVLFPEAMAVNKEPELIKRQDKWVSEFLDGVHKTPFTRIKSTAVNITATEARAKGYIKNTQKVDEVIKALKRVTTPQTIYKKQKIDRDDMLDITDFDVVAFLKAEMRILLNEELARACTVGDGRASDAPDKINPENIRPIYGDSDVYTIYKKSTIAGTETNKQLVDKITEDVLTARNDYKGSGNLIMIIEPNLLTKLLLAQDLNGRRIYNTEAELASAMRVSKIVESPVFTGVTRSETIEGTAHTYNLLALFVDLKDYNIGTDKGGQVSLFDDFDIDYNQYKYLIESRVSAALVKPYSAIALEYEATTSVG